MGNTFGLPQDKNEGSKSNEAKTQNLPAQEGSGWVNVTTAKELSSLKELSDITQALQLALKSKDSNPNTVTLQIDLAVKLMALIRTQPQTFAIVMILGEAKETINNARTQFNLFSTTSGTRQETTETAKNLSLMQRNSRG